MKPKILQRPLSYVQRLERRCTDDIRLIVLHCTELPDMTMAREWGEKLVHTGSRTGNSGHFYIDRDGSMQQWVPLDRIAHHVRGYNATSIGIELVNNGRYPDWFESQHQQMTEPYTGAQIESLASLLNHLMTQLPGLKQLTGHEDLDTELLPAEDRPDIMINRKLDPGPLFPWPDLMAKILLNRVSASDL